MSWTGTKSIYRPKTHTHTHTLREAFTEYVFPPRKAQTWCDDGAYLLANQLVDKLQSKEGAQTALQDIEKFLEEAPSMLSSGPDVLAVEYEGVITPQLQVSNHGYFNTNPIKVLFSSDVINAKHIAGPCILTHTTLHRKLLFITINVVYKPHTRHT